MLFDLRARGRRRTVKIVYVFLALLMGGGLIFFGIGGATSGGLLDAFKGGGGGGSGTDVLQKTVVRMERQVRLRPRDPAAWAALARAQYQVAGVGDNYDTTTGTYTAKGKQALIPVERSWERYLALNPPKPSADLASLMVQALGPQGLNHADKAVAAQEIVIAARPASAGLYLQLAAFAYQAGQIRKGDLSSQKAVELAPKDQRTALRDQLKQLRQAAVTPSAQTQTTPGTG